MGICYQMKPKKMKIDPGQFSFLCYEVLPPQDVDSVVNLNNNGAMKEIGETIKPLKAESLKTKQKFSPKLFYFAIARERNEVVGFCYGSAEKDENSRGIYNIYEISVLYVKPECRVKNVGKNLMITLQNHIISLPEGKIIEHFKAITQPENLIAINMLESIGYYKPRTIEEYQLASAL